MLYADETLPSTLIKKGELEHDGDVSNIMFPSGMAWRKYYILSLPRKKACDVIDWTWTQQTEEGGECHMFAAMNISVLLNNGENNEININPKVKSTDNVQFGNDSLD